MNASAVGPVHFDIVSDVITYAIDIIVPVINYIIGSGFPLPSYEGVTAQDTGIDAEKGVLTVSSDITYNPTTEATRQLKHFDEPARG